MSKSPVKKQKENSASVRVLHVAAEVFPFVKTGGLADMVTSLAAASVEAGIDARVVLPGYRQALETAGKMGLEWLPGNLTIEAGGYDHHVGVGRVTTQGVTCYLLACNELYDRFGIYGPSAAQEFEDNPRRYSVFCKAALALPRFLNWIPHVLHAHDWQAGLVPALLQRGFLHDLPATRSVFTVHNPAYQGNYKADDLRLTGLDGALFNPMQAEHHGRINFLKIGAVFCDRLTTVSRRFAAEIQEPQYGFGLDAVFRGLAYKLSGITNGIDTSVWNPATDPHLPANYTAEDLSGKKICKTALQKELGLGTDDRPLVGIISRLVDQKGIDLAIDAVRPELAAGRMQLAVLGSGDSNLEWRLKELQNSFPGAVCFWVGYNEALAHRIEAGSDLFLMPSRYEPCGLNQMYSLRYGTLPLVRYTGGLADRVTDICSGHGNGFTFGPVDSGHLRAVLDRALAHHFMFRYEWDQIVAHAMRQDFCWSGVAGEYLDLYRKLCVV